MTDNEYRKWLKIILARFMGDGGNIWSRFLIMTNDNRQNKTKRPYTQLDSRKQVIAF